MTRALALGEIASESTRIATKMNVTEGEQEQEVAGEKSIFAARS